MTALTIYLDHQTERRLRQISEELGEEIHALAFFAVAETALNHFRHRPQADPGRTVEMKQHEGTWQ